MPGITNPAEEHFDKGLWGYDGSAWRKLALLWGYTDRYSEDLGGTKSGAGQYVGTGTSVPAGEVWTVNFVTLRNQTGSRGAGLLMVHDGSLYYRFAYEASSTQSIPLIFTGSLPLKEGDYIQVRMDACSDNDVLQAGVWGYKMAVI